MTRCTCHRTPPWVTAARVGLLLTLAWPFLATAAEYIWTQHTLTGLASYEAATTIDGTLAWAGAALQDPAPAIAQTLLLSALTALARPHRRHR